MNGLQTIRRLNQSTPMKYTFEVRTKYRTEEIIVFGSSLATAWLEANAECNTLGYDATNLIFRSEEEAGVPAPVPCDTPVYPAEVVRR